MIEERGVYLYAGEGLAYKWREFGLGRREVVSVTRTGKSTVHINANSNAVINWFVERDDLDYEEETDE
jgi:hypothetical protein